jgi:phage terminase large subunit-like protein
VLPDVLLNAEPAQIEQLREALKTHIAERRLELYRPYPKQRAFHAAGATNSERLFIAGNQLGKSLAGGAEWAMHLTGRYPDWWEGAVFNQPVKLWASSVTTDATRDNPQRVLVGPPAIEESWGTGMIPKDALKEWHRAMGTANLLDSVLVRWGGGGDVQADISVLGFKHYAQGREKWQGPTLDGVWFDEECPLDIYSEGMTRTNRGQRGQFVMMTFTPLLGMSEVVRMFLQQGKP